MTGESAVATTTEEVPPLPKVNCDAIFMPGSAGEASYVAPMLSMMGLSNIQLLGTMRWNDTAFIRKNGKYLEGAIFVQSFDLGSSNPTVRIFVDRFKGAYNVDPTLLEGLGYDSMNMIIKASANGSFKRDSIRKALAETKDYPGVTGSISFNESRDAVRKMNVMRISNGQAKNID